MVLAANRLVLCDQGRPKEWAAKAKKGVGNRNHKLLVEHVL